MSMYNALIAKGTMHVSEVENVTHSDCMEDIYESLMTGHAVILDTDLNRLSAMADQLGLAFATYPKQGDES